MKKNTLLLLIIFLVTNLSIAVIPERTGWWKFDNATTLLKAESGYGEALSLIGTHSPTAGPETGNGAVLIGTGSYYKMNHTIAPNGGGSKVNEYTLQFDFKIMKNDVWNCFFQTSPNNSNDGELFINPSGNIGVAAVGYSTATVAPNEWYRLIVSVKNGKQFTCYLDGELLLNGVSQALDGRFSLENQVLVFADEDGEDAPVYCAELAVWNRALTAAETKELGGYGHKFELPVMTRIPYLQSPGQTSMTVCWHDSIQTGTKVEYGTDSLKLLQEKTGTSEIVSLPYRWHSAKLTGLTANTRYFYKVGSGNERSETYSFKTLPEAGYQGKLRFVLLSDTHATDTTMAGKIIRAAKAKITSLYGSDIENHLNGIFHSGDIVVSGNSPHQYTKQYFMPMSSLSPHLPTMVVAGNHEGESPFFYRYLKMDELAAYPQLTSLNEKIWQLRIGNSLFLGLNTNIINEFGTTQANWLDTKLKETELDASIDFVFLFMHHPPYSELWNVVNTFDAGANYVRDKLIPIIRKYTKVQQLTYGHTHGFERGTVLSEKPDGDFRIVCGGGSGGPLDPWAPGANRDYNNIHKSYSHYCFQILEIDLAGHSWHNSMYSLGSTNNSENAVILDTWYKQKNQAAPDTPVIESATNSNENIVVNTSKFSGSDSIMSVQFQITESSNMVLDSMIHWTNIYGISGNNVPVDKNAGINLNRFSISQALISEGKTYTFSVRYRDHNLKWSAWSEPFLYQATGIKNSSWQNNDRFLGQNFPNPFHSKTTIKYELVEKSEIHFRIYDVNFSLVAEIAEGVKPKGNHVIVLNAGHFKSGVYFYEMIAKDFSVMKKMIRID